MRNTVVLLASVSLLACGDRPLGPETPDDVGPAGPKRVIEPIVEAPAPTRLRVSNGSLYWLDTSDVPLNRLSLGEDVYTPLFTALPIPESVVSDGQDLYWISGARLYKTSADGATTTLVDEGQRDAAVNLTASIALDATHVFWANSVASQSCSPACTFTIRRVPRAGGAATTVITTSAPIVAFDVSGGDIYWAEERAGPLDPDGSGGSEVKKVSLAGGPVTVLVDGRLNGLIPLPPQGQLVASWRPGPAIEADGSSVFFATSDFVDSYTVMRVGITGGGVVIAAEVNTGDADFVRDLEIDADNVYWVDATSLRTVPKAGGPWTDLAPGLDSPIRLALSGETLFWVETRCCGHGQTGTIKKIALAGGAPVTLKTDIDSPVGISADATRLYWVEGGSIGAIEGFGRIASITHDGAGESIVVESATGGAFDVDATHVYFANQFTIKRVPISGGRVQRLAIGDFNVTDVATDGVDVFWAEDPQATVRKMPVGGGPVATLGTGNGPAGTIMLDATHVYWGSGDASIIRVAKDGGSQSTVVGPVAGLFTDFVVHGGSLYFAEWDAARIQKTATTGGSISTLRQLLPDQTRRLATDGVSVYWIDQLEVGKIGVLGDSVVRIASVQGGSSPFVANGIAVDGTRLFWSEVVADLIRMATPK